MNGWIKLHRQIQENSMWLSGKFDDARAWIDLLLLANRKEGMVNVRGIRIKIPRGYVGWSEVSLAKRWKWSRNKVRRFIMYLEMEQQVIQHKSLTLSLIEVKNYERYQSNDTTDETADDTTDGQQTIQQTDTNKKEKKSKKEKKLSSAAALRDQAMDELKPTTTVDSDTKKPIALPKHLEPLAMYCVLFGVKYPSREEWSAFIKRNTRLSKELSELPIDSLAKAMLLAEDHWAQKKDYEIRLETVHKFLENVGRAVFPAGLLTRKEQLLREFERNKITVFLPSPAAHAH